MHMASTPRTVITNILGLISLLMAIGTIVLFGFNTPIKSIITIAAVAVTGLILASIIGSLIKKFDLLHLHIPMPWNKGKSQSYIRNIYPL